MSTTNHKDLKHIKAEMAKKLSRCEAQSRSTTEPKAKAKVGGRTGSATLPTGNLVTVRITRKEFRSLPLGARRRILREQAEIIVHASEREELLERITRDPRLRIASRT